MSSRAGSIVVANSSDLHEMSPTHRVPEAYLTCKREEWQSSCNTFQSFEELIDTPCIS